MCLCPEEGGKEGDQVGLRKAGLRMLGRSLMGHKQGAVAWKLLVSVESSKRSPLLNLELRKVWKGKFPGAGQWEVRTPQTLPSLLRVHAADRLLSTSSCSLNSVDSSSANPGAFLLQRKHLVPSHKRETQNLLPLV